jgi:hypothetical protein
MMLVSERRGEMAMRLHAPRRREGGRLAGTAATYRFDDSSGNVWVPCRVLDMSLDGAALELFACAHDEPLDGRVVVVSPHTDEGERSGVHLRGEIRDAGPGEEGGLRVEIKFVALSAIDRAVLGLLIERVSLA